MQILCDGKFIEYHRRLTLKDDERVQLEVERFDGDSVLVHVSRPDSPTAGSIAMNREDARILARELNKVVRRSWA